MMKTISTEIRQLENHSAHLALITHPRLVCNFHSRAEYHSHPEAELLIILKGEGYKIINGALSRFQAGDMVFLRPNVPHIWVVDEFAEQPDNKSLLVYINPKSFRNLFEHLEEFALINNFLNNESPAISFNGSTKESVLKQLKTLLHTDGFEKIMGIFRVIHELALSGNYEEIACAKQLAIPEPAYNDPLLNVLQFVQRNLSRPLSLSEAAGVAHMSASEFAVYFKKRLKSTFYSFLKGQRFDKARSYLTQTDKQISEISSLCGYASTSRFCQLFREQFGKSPLQFRYDNSMLRSV